jgi:hypothetical protein
MCRSVIALTRVLPDAAVDALVRSQFPVPRPSPQVQGPESP